MDAVSVDVSSLKSHNFLAAVLVEPLILQPYVFLEAVLVEFLDCASLHKHNLLTPVSLWAKLDHMNSCRCRKSRKSEIVTRSVRDFVIYEVLTSSRSQSVNGQIPEKRVTSRRFHYSHKLMKRCPKMLGDECLYICKFDQTHANYRH